MSAAPIRIGPALRESAAVAIGHWPIVLLSLAALFVWSALVLIAITGCTPPLACIGPSAPGELDGWAALGIWGGTRFIGWIILGGVVYRTLIREAGLHATASEQRDPRLRLLLACVLCFAGSSLAVFALRAAVLTAVSAIGDPVGDLSDRARPASFVAEGVIVILVWSYLSARSAIFAASILRHGDSARFGRSWADASRLRLPLFLALAAIHTLLVAIQGMVYYSHPQLLDQSHLAVLVMYPPSAAFDAALTAGVFVVVFRRLAGSEAQVFD